ncbi:MAG TPA: M48 family metallopeptidase [Verrucomicrobiae bacterium]|nr:M48 family metallopeptidase [Verrucomicrobiae bacterium]
MKEDVTSFVASAIRTGVEEAIPLEGSLMLDRWQARFTGEDLVVEIPLARLQIEIGEAGEICFTDPDHPEWMIHTWDEQVLQASVLQRQAHTFAQLKELGQRGDLNRRLKITSWVLAAFAVLAVIATITVRMMVRSLANRVPVKWEQDMGVSAMEKLQKERVFVSNPKLLARIDQAAAPLLAVLPKSQIHYTFYVMEDRLPNAFSLPGGHIVVTTSLLDLADGPEELAGVLAHELAHETQRHVFRKIISSLGPYVIFTMFVGDGPLRALSQDSQLLASQSFSQGYELEADSVGWDYLVAAKVDPRGMINILSKLKLVQDRLMVGAITVQALSSHPATQKRIDRLQARWKKLKQRDDFIHFDSRQPPI